MVIRRVNPMSLAKILGVVGVVVGLIIGACMSLLAMVAGGLASATGDADAGGALGFGMIFGAGAIVIAPIFYGVFMFVMGLIYAFVYNLAAKWVGGVEIEAS